MLTEYFEESLEKFSCHDCLLTLVTGGSLDSSSRFAKAVKNPRLSGRALYRDSNMKCPQKGPAVGSVGHWVEGQCAVSLLSTWTSVGLSGLEGLDCNRDV